MKRSTVKFVSIFMEAMGVPVLDTPQRSLIRKCLLYTSILCDFWMSIQFIVVNILQINNFYGFTFSLSYLCIMIFISVGLIANLRVLQQTKQLLKNIDENIYTYENDLEIFPAEERLLHEKTTMRIFLYMFSAFFISTMTNILSPLIQFCLMDHVVVIVYPGWIPWSTDGVRAFVCAYLLQVGTVLLGTLQFSFLSCFPMFVVFEFQHQFRRLHVALKTIESRSRSGCLNRRGVNGFDGCISEIQYSSEYTNNIVSCIQHYQMLISTFQLFQPWWQIVFSIQLTTSAPIFTLAAFCFIETNIIQEKLSLSTVIWVVALGVLFYSYIGEEFLKLNEEMKNIIFYEIPWYEAPTEAKRLLLVFHLLVSKRPFTLNGLYIFQASYRTFGYICKSSYSSINVLKATIRK